MNHLCGCAGESGFKLKLPKFQKTSGFCMRCGRKRVTNMISSLGLEVSGLIDPYLNWKTVSKAKPRAGRRARTSFSSIIDGKPLAILKADSRKKVLKSETKITGEIVVSDSEKVGVTILGQRFGDVVLENIPIKKRRFLLRSPSPPPSPPCPPIKDETHQKLSKVQKSNSSSTDGTGALTGMKRKFGDCIDFSGISILAAVACDTETLDSEQVPAGKGGQATTTTETTSNLTEDSQTNNNSSGESMLGRGSSSREDKFPWDLNLVMDEETLPELEDVPFDEKETDMCRGSHADLVCVVPILSHTPDLAAEKQCGTLIEQLGQTEKKTDLCGKSRADNICIFPVMSRVSEGIETSIELGMEEESLSPSHVKPSSQAEKTSDSCRDSRADLYDPSKWTEKNIKPSSSLICAGPGENETYFSNIAPRTAIVPEEIYKKTEVAAEEESSSQYEDGEFRESFISGWGIDGRNEHKAEECVDYGTDDVGDERNLAGLPPGQLDDEPNHDSGRRMEIWPSSANSSACVMETEKEETLLPPISRRVRFSGWDRLPGDSAVMATGRDRGRDRAYFSIGRHGRQSLEIERSVRRDGPGRRERFFPRDATNVSMAKVQGNGFVVSTDGTILGAEFPPQRFPPEIGPRRRGSPFYRRDRSFSPVGRSPSPSRSPPLWRRRRSRSPEVERPTRPLASPSRSPPAWHRRRSRSPEIVRQSGPRLPPQPRWLTRGGTDGIDRRWARKVFYRPDDRYGEDFGRDGGSGQFRLGYRRDDDEKDRLPYFRPGFAPQRRRHS